MKLRNASFIVTPGYNWLDRVWVGENDLGGFDPWVIGKIRYIDRFNISAIQVDGSASKRKFQWTVIRMSNSMFLEPNNTGGQFQPADGTWGFQAKGQFSGFIPSGGFFEGGRDFAAGGEVVAAADHAGARDGEIGFRFQIVLGRRLGLLHGLESPLR